MKTQLKAESIIVGALSRFLYCKRKLASARLLYLNLRLQVCQSVYFFSIFPGCFSHLNDNVECDVEVSAMDEHVGEEPPHFLLQVRVKNQRTRDEDGTVRSDCLAFVGEEDHVVDEHADLAQAHQQQEHRGGPAAADSRWSLYDNDHDNNMT